MHFRIRPEVLAKIEVLTDRRQAFKSEICREALIHGLAAMELEPAPADRWEGKANGQIHRRA